MNTFTDPISFFCRHLVAISVEAKRLDGTTDHNAVTAFLLDVRGRWFLVTAGHILEQLLRLRSHPSLASVEVRLFDAWATDAKCRMPIPFDLHGADTFAVDEAGLDLGLIEVTDFYRRQLSANGIVALDRTTWMQPSAGFDSFMLLGLPSDFIRLLPGGGLQISPTLVTVKETTPPAEMAMELDRFYGQLPPVFESLNGEPLTDLDGFSGGPILGFRRTEKGLVYYVVAIQSTWRRDLRVVAAVRAQNVGIALDAALEKFGRLPG